VVAEDTFRDHNASALIRTCDCFGIQDMHVIEEYHTFRIARGMAKGAQKWVDVHFYNEYEDNVQFCIDTLKKTGYKIVAATPHHTDTNLQEFDIGKPAAICFGKEKAGLSKQVLQQADDFIKIPMVGFSESFNISVSAAIILQTLTSQLHKRRDIAWQLSDMEVMELKLDWCLKTIQNGPKIATDFLKGRI
jgi:tRNA (guanosine-2'-O-)-methyltransferase